MRFFTKMSSAWDEAWKYYEESRFPKVAVRVACGTIALCAQYYLASHYDPPGLNQGSNGVIFTKRGEVHCEYLSDWTDICVNSDSEVHYRYTRVARTIEVVRGEVSVTVHKDKRPLDLLAGRTLIHDIATSYVVYRRPDSVLVTDTEGRIRVVAPIDSDSKMMFHHGEPSDSWKKVPDLHKFQRVEFNEETGQLRQLPDASEQELQQLAAWKEGRILLNGRTVDSAIHELRRYGDIPQIIYDPSIGSQPLQGDIPFNDVDLFLADLEYEFHIHHHRKGTGSHAQIILTR